LEDRRSLSAAMPSHRRYAECQSPTW
jgi:hypothetical protein